MTTLTNAASPEPIDSGPGPLDVLEARITLETRHALDAAQRAVERLLEQLAGPDVQPQPRHVARIARLAADDIEHALGVADALARVTGRSL